MAPPELHVLRGSPAEDRERIPLVPAATVTSFGPTLVVAPHPDDESLGCGGAIALLVEGGLPVHVVFVSDGSGSHPGSRHFPPDALVALREREALAALQILGVPREHATFLRLSDRHVPRTGSSGFGQAVAHATAFLRWLPASPQTVLLPWRRDPHTDHRASWEIVDVALEHAGLAPRRIEYPIWLWELAGAGDAPSAGEVCAWRLDIERVLPRKLAAIAAHRSQTTPLVHDAPSGWYIKPDILAHFSQPWEVYFEARDRMGTAHVDPS